MPRHTRVQFLQLGAAGHGRGGRRRGASRGRARPGRRPPRRATTSASCSGPRPPSWSRSPAGTGSPPASRSIRGPTAGCTRCAGRTPGTSPRSTRSSATRRRPRRTSPCSCRSARSRSPARALALAEEIHDHLVRVYLRASRRSADPATRLLLGQLLVNDTQHLDALRALRGRAERLRRPARPARPRAGGHVAGPLPPRPLLRPLVTPMRRLIPALLLPAALLAAPAAAQAAPTVYAAASLRAAFPEIDGSPTYNFAGSNVLQRQIENGAPADVFARREPEGGAGAVRGRPLHAPGHVRHQQGRRARARGQPGGHPVDLRPQPRRAQAAGRRRGGRADRRLHAPAARPHAAERDPHAQHRVARDERGQRDRRRSRSGRRTPASPTRPTPPSPATASSGSGSRSGRSRRSATRCAPCAGRGADTAGAQAFIRRVTSRAGRRTLKRVGLRRAAARAVTCAPASPRFSRCAWASSSRSSRCRSWRCSPRCRWATCRACCASRRCGTRSRRPRARTRSPTR